MNNLALVSGWVAVATFAVAVVLILLIPGVVVYNLIFKVPPTLPDPGDVPALSGGVQPQPSHAMLETIEVKVPGAGRERFIRTIKKGAINAGGWIKAEHSPSIAHVFSVIVRRGAT